MYSPTAMHIPDGFLSAAVSAVGWALALAMIGIALRQTREQLGERRVPLMGVLAAFIFAAQAINFPVAAGTSGHLLGGALAAIVMGPWAATLIMTAVIAVQGLLFQDGGLLVMGWNILNMGVFTAFTGQAVYSLLRPTGDRSRWMAASVAAWLSVEVGAMTTSVELAVSGTSPLGLALPAMAGVHALIGFGEAIITAGALAMLRTARPQVLEMGEAAPGKRGAALVTAGVMLALIMAVFSPLASSSPDGLERVAAQQGFLGLKSRPLFSILPGYALPFIASRVATTILAVALGVLAVFALVWITGRMSFRR